MSRQLFIYWKVDAACADAALAAAAAMQAQLREQHPGLRASLFRRSDDAGPQVTLMEVYAAMAGVGSGLQSDIERAAAAHLARLAPGPRHVEVFTAL